MSNTILPAGSVVQAPFVFGDERPGRAPGRQICVVMASHERGMLLCPIVQDRPVNRDRSLRLDMGPDRPGKHVMCDRRNLVEAPADFLVAHRGADGKPTYVLSRIEDGTFEEIKRIHLECCDQGMVRDTRIRPSTQADRTASRPRGPRDETAPRRSVTDLAIAKAARNAPRTEHTALRAAETRRGRSAGAR